MSVEALTSDAALRFEQMGRAIITTADATATADAGPDGWTLITGAPAADANMVAIYRHAPQYLATALVAVEARACPTLLMFADSATALGATLDHTWSHVGAMPIMAADLATTPMSLDPRVRRATQADAAVIGDLGAEAFGMPADIFRLFTDPAIPGPMRAYVLEDDGAIVSTVITGLVDDTVSVWCMSTPEARQRRGYGRALLAHALADGASAGAKVGLLGATEAGYPLYSSTGWETFAEWQVYLNAESAQFG